LFWLSGKPKVKCFESALLSIHRTLRLMPREGHSLPLRSQPIHKSQRSKHRVSLKL